MKQLGVIILNWNGIDLLKELIPDAVKYTSGNEVDLIVADNGSTDDSVAWLRENYPSVKILEFPENYGFAEGYNRAVEQCRQYPFVTLLNSDVLVTPDWWRPLLKFMVEHPDVAACQPKIKSYRNRDCFEYAGAAGGLLDALSYPYCRGRLFDVVEKDNGQYDNKIVDIAWASGAALTCRTELYLKLGGLDSRFFAHMEEIDLCIRMQTHGYRICFIPDSQVYHVGGASLPQGNPKKTYLNFRNNLLLIYKNSPLGKGVRRTFVRRLVDTMAIALYAVKGDFAGAKAIIKAHIDYRKMSRNYTQFPQHDVLRNVPGSNRYIIFDRFLPGKKNDNSDL